MVYDMPTLVVNRLRKSSLYNPFWNTQILLTFVLQYRYSSELKKKKKIACKK